MFKKMRKTKDIKNPEEMEKEEIAKMLIEDMAMTR
jgi:hypothetical protein